MQSNTLDMYELLLADARNATRHIELPAEKTAFIGKLFRGGRKALADRRAAKELAALSPEGRAVRELGFDADAIAQARGGDREILGVYETRFQEALAGGVPPEQAAEWARAAAQRDIRMTGPAGLGEEFPGLAAARNAQLGPAQQMPKGTPPPSAAPTAPTAPTPAQAAPTPAAKADTAAPEEVASPTKQAPESPSTTNDAPASAPDAVAPENVASGRSRVLRGAGVAAAIGGAGAAGHQYGKAEEAKRGKRTRNLAFGAGLAAGTAAPGVINGLRSSYGGR